MMQSISWQQYTIFVVISTLLYYLFVWVIYFKAKIPSFIVSGRSGLLFSTGEDQPDEMLSTAQHVIDEIKPVFINRSNKNELIMALQKCLQRYRHWDEPDFRKTINEFIIHESLGQCAICLGEDDIRVLWTG